MNYKFKQCIPRKNGTKIDCCGAELVLHHEKCEKFFGEIEKNWYERTDKLPYQ